MVEPLVDAVVNRAVGEETGETTTARLEQTFGSLDVEIGVLLTGEARLRQILGGGVW